MSSVANLQPDPAPILACTISRDVQNFDLLIDDMEQELGESWGDLGFEDALIFFGQPESALLQFVAIAVDSEDESDLSRIGDIIRTAKEKAIKVILIADQVSPIALHQLLRLGADDFVPYPLPEGALHEAIDRVRAPAPAALGGGLDRADPAPAADLGAARGHGQCVFRGRCRHRDANPAGTLDGSPRQGSNLSCDQAPDPAAGHARGDAGAPCLTWNEPLAGYRLAFPELLVP
mgnify:CR=1 FL=1